MKIHLQSGLISPACVLPGLRGIRHQRGPARTNQISSFAGMDLGKDGKGNHSGAGEQVKEREQTMEWNGCCLCSNTAIIIFEFIGVGIIILRSQASLNFSAGPWTPRTFKGSRRIELRWKKSAHGGGPRKEIGIVAEHIYAPTFLIIGNQRRERPDTRSARRPRETKGIFRSRPSCIRCCHSIYAYPVIFRISSAFSIISRLSWFLFLLPI